MISVLFLGVGPQDPNIDLPPNVSAQALDAAINKGYEDLKNAGYKVNLFLPPIMEGIAALEKEMQTTKYDLVLVGVSAVWPIMIVDERTEEDVLTCWLL